MIKGLPMAYMVYQHYKLSDVAGVVHDLKDLPIVELKGENVRAFLNEWEYRLCGSRTPLDDQ